MNYILPILFAIGLLLGGKGVYQYFTMGHSLKNLSSAVPFNCDISVNLAITAFYIFYKILPVKGG